MSTRTQSLWDIEAKRTVRSTGKTVIDRFKATSDNGIVDVEKARDDAKNHVVSTPHTVSRFGFLLNNDESTLPYIRPFLTVDWESRAAISEPGTIYAAYGKPKVEIDRYKCMAAL